MAWRARAWRRMLEEGDYRNQSELAWGEGVSTAAVSIALKALREERGLAAHPTQVYVDVYVEVPMAQVTLYMDDDTMARMRAAAEAAGLSMSAWLAQLVKERTRTEWPREVAALAGAWRDLPGAEKLREAQPEDTARETL